MDEGYFFWLGLVIGAFFAAFATALILVDARPTIGTAFKSVCEVQGGIAYNTTDFKPVCVKAGQVINVPITK